MTTLLNVSRISCFTVMQGNDETYQIDVNHVDANGNSQKETFHTDDGVTMKMKLISGSPALCYSAGNPSSIQDVGFCYNGRLSSVDLAIDKYPSGSNVWRLEHIGGIDVRDGYSPMVTVDNKVGIMTNVYLRAIKKSGQGEWDFHVVKERNYL